MQKKKARKMILIGAAAFLLWAQPVNASEPVEGSKEETVPEASSEAVMSSQVYDEEVENTDTEETEVQDNALEEAAPVANEQTEKNELMVASDEAEDGTVEEDPLANEPDEDASMELPDGTAYVEEIGVDVMDDEVFTYTNTASGTAGSTHSGNAIQNAFDAAVNYALGKNWEDTEEKKVTVVVENGEYVGDLNFINTMGSDSFMDVLLAQYGMADNTFFKDFTFVIRSRDALDENGNLSANGAGGARVKGNLLISNLNVVLAGLSFGLDNSITVRDADTFEFYGTSADDVVDIYIDSVNETVYIDLGDGDDTLVANVDQAPAFNVGVTENVITQLTLPENILDMIKNMAEAELNNILTYGISPSTSPTLNSLMDGLNETAKAALEGELLTLIEAQLAALGENISDMAVELDVTVNGGAGHDRLQVTVNNNSNLDLMPMNPMQGEYGIASLTLQMDMSRTNVTMYGGDGNDQMMVDGNWKGMYQTMLLHKAMEELTQATLQKLNDETAEVRLYGGADDDTLQINTDYAFTTVWNAKAYMDGGDGVDRTNLTGAVNDGILAGIIPQNVTQIQKSEKDGTTTYTLDAMKAWTLIENNIIGFEQEIFWINRDFEIDNSNVETVTDSLSNKFSEDIEWTANGYNGNKLTVESFKDYVIEITQGMVDGFGEAVAEFVIDVRDFFTNPNEPGFLTQLLINLLTTDTVKINQIYAPGWTVLITGYDMILGDITAGDLFASAVVPDLTVDGTIPQPTDTNIEMSVKDTTNTEVQNNLDGEVDISIKSYLYGYEGKSSITMEGNTKVDRLAVITSSITLDKGFITLPDIANQITGGINPNIAVYKEGLSEVKILGNIEAAAIQISAITNVDIDTEFLMALPLSGGVSRTNNYIIIGRDSSDDTVSIIATDGNVWISAKTNVRINAVAKAMASIPIAGSVAYMESENILRTLGNVTIAAKGDVDMEADTVVNLDAVTTGATPYTVAVDVNSGEFPALQVALIDNKVEITGNTNIISQTDDINIKANSRLESTVLSLSVPGEGQESAFKMLAALKFLEYFTGVPQGSFVKSKVPLYNITNAVIEYFKNGTMGATEENAYQPKETQFVGAFSVDFIEHNNQVLIDTDGTLEAAEDVNVEATADTVVDARADGSLYKTAAIAGLIGTQHQPNNAVGIGVGVNIITHNNKATYNKGIVKADGLKVTADSYTPNSLIVKAGHVPTESSLGIVGAIAVNVYSTTTEATIEEAAEAELGNGKLIVTAYQDADAKLIGDASGRRSTLLDYLTIGSSAPGAGTLPRVGSKGFGTGIVVNVTGMDVTARVKGAINQRDNTKLESITISSIFDGTEYVEARAGASAGIAIVPVVIVNLSGVSALTEVETGTTLLTRGDANILSEVNMIRTLIADADTVSTNVGFGGTFLINISEDTSEAYLYSSITADGDVNVTAETISRLNGQSYASSKGSQGSLSYDQISSEQNKYLSGQSKGQADQFADKNLQNTSTMANDVNSRNTNSNKINKKVKNRQMASTAEGQVQVAAGFALNIQDSKSIAAIGKFKEAETGSDDDEGDSETEEDAETIYVITEDLPEITISAKDVTVETRNDTDGIIVSSAAAVNSSVAVGVAVAINMVDYNNQVIVGNANVDADTLTLQSVAIEIAHLKETEELVEELVTFITDVVGIEKFLQSIIYYEENNGTLPTDEKELNAKYDDLDEILHYFDNKEFNEDYENGGGDEVEVDEDADTEEALERNYSELTAAEKELVKAQLNKALTNAILGGQTSDVAGTAVDAIVESLATKIKEAMTMDNFLVMLLTGKNMFSEAFAQASTLFNGTVPRIQMALAQYLNGKFGGAEEMDGVGHKISTQTISGAGASNVGVAGSVAISLVNGKTVVTILDREALAASGKDLVVDGDLIVNAETVQKIYTTAASSAHELGTSKDRLAAHIASANASGSSTKHKVSKTDKLTASGSGVGVGASVAFAKADNHVEASIGANRDITAGNVSVTANLRNDVESISVAGQDPIARRDSIFKDEEQLTPPQITPGQTPTIQQTVYHGTDPQMASVDASVAIGMSENTVIARIGKNANLAATGNLEVTAKEHGEGYAQSSGYAAGSRAAVGASAAANIAASDIIADFGGNGIVAGDAVIQAEAYNEDTAYALATTTGALLDRILQKIGDIQRWVSLGSEGGISSNTISNMLMNQLNGMLSPLTGMTAQPASTTFLKMLGIQIPASSKIPASVTNTAQNLGNALQAAAAVGVNLTQHNVTASVTGSLQAANVDVTANNKANYRTVASGFNVVIYDVGGDYKISTGVAVSKNQNSANAIVDGIVTSDKDVNVYAQTTQNMDGTYAGLLTAQALSGGFGGTAIPAGFTLTGAFAGSFGEAATKAEVKDNAKIEAKGDVNVIAIDWSKQAVRAGSASLTANSVATAGASVAVIDSENKIYALIGKNAEIKANDLTVQAFMLNVNEEDYVFPLDKSILITTGSNTDEEDKGIIHINMEPGKEGFGVNLETKDLLALVDAINYFATVNYYAEAISAEVAIGGTSMANIAGAVSVVLINNIVEAIINEAATINLSGDLTVDAQADTIARVIAGSASAGIARFGTGLGVAVLDESNQITANAGVANGTAKGSVEANNILVNAKNREEVLVISVGMAAATGNLGLGGSATYAGNEGTVNAGIGSNYDVTANSVTVNAVNETDIKVITTSPTIVAAADAIAAAGGSMTIINTAKETIAFIGDKTTVNSVNDIIVSAKTVEKFLNVSASLSATAGVVSGAATVDTLGSYSTTKASVGNSTTLKSEYGDIKVLATADSELYNILAAVSGSRTLAIGAVHMMNDLNRTVIAEVGTSSILEALNGSVEIMADADSFILVPTVVGAVAGNVAADGLIVTVLGKDTVKALVGDFSIITAEGVVKIIADNYQELYEAGLTLAGSATASAGGSVIDFITENTVEATTGDYVSITGYNRKDNRDAKYRGINIQAFNYNRVVVANAGGAAAAGPVAVNGIVQNVIMKNKVIAGAGKHNALNISNVERNGQGEITSGSHAQGSKDQGIIIEADDESELYIISGGLGASTSVGVGVGTQVLVYDNTVTAGIGDGSKSFALGNIDVLAYSTNTVWQVNASLTANGTAAVDVSANVIVFENEVTASLGGEAKAANIYVIADSKNEITQIVVSFAASGTATVVPMSQVVYFESITKAYTFDGAVLNADGEVVIEALSREKLNSDSGQAAIAGTAGIGGTVIVAVTKQQTSAYTGANNTINAANIYINAYDDYEYLVVNASLSGGGVAVGVNGSVHVSFSTVSAYVGDNSNLTASGDVEVTAVSDRNITMYGMSVTAAPSVGVGVTIQVAVNGGKVNQDSADEINKYLTAEKISNALGYGRGSEHALNDYLTARKEILADAMEGDGVKKTDTTLGSETAGGFDFDAQTGYYDKDKLEDIENKEENLDKDGVADLTFDPDSNEDIEGAAGLYDELPESYKDLDNQKDTVYASIGAGTVVNAGNNILVSADDILTVELVTGNVTGSGPVAVGAGMAVIVTNTEVTATVGDGATLTAGGNIEILADGNYVLNAIAINGSVAGTISVSGTVAAIDIYSNIEATLKGDVKGAKNLYVKATMENQKLNAQTLSASASSTVSVPVSIAMVLMNGRLEAGISGADISGVNNIYVSTGNHFAPTVESLTAGAAMVAVRGSIALAINRQKQYTYIDEASSVAGAKIVSVTAAYDSTLKPILIGGNAGKVSIGLQAVVAIDTPEILTYIGVRPTVEKVGTASKTIEADQIIVGHTVTSDVSTRGAFAGGGLFAADMTVMLAINRLTAIAAIRGINIDAGSVNVYANMDANAVSEVLSAQVGGMTVGATAFVSQLFAENKALIETTGSDIAAESITVTAGTKEDINEMTSEAAGLAAGAGAVNVRVNVAVADNNAVNAARIFGTGKVTVTGSVTVDAYGKALATAKVLAAELSATGSVGAQFALALLRAQQTAEAGDGGIFTADNITVHAELNQDISESQATATVSNISGSMVGADANIAVAMNRSSNKAGAGADTLNVNGAIDVKSQGKSRAEAKAEMDSLRFVTAGAQVTYAYAEGIFDSWLYVGQTGNAGSVNVNTTYNTHAKANSIPTGFGLFNIKGNAAVAEVDGTATAKVRGNGSLTVTGAVNVVTSGSAAAVAEVPNVQMVNIGGANIGINVAVALVEQKQTAEVSIKNLDAASLTVHALLNGEGETTKANVGSADSYVQAQIVNGEVNVAYARNSAVAEALVSGTNVASKGAIVVRSEGTVNASADRYNPEAQVSLIDVNVIHTHAVTNGRFEAKAAFGSGTSSANSLTVETLFDSLTYAAAEAAGSVINYEGIGVNSAYAKTTHQFNAGVEVKGNLNVSKDVLIQTKGHARAEAIIRTGYFSLNAVNVAGNAATTYADAIQNVWFKVTGTSEIGGNLNVKAILESKDGKESGAHSIIAPQKNSGVSLSLINGEANVLTTESRMDTKVEVNGGTKTTIGGNLTVTTDLTTVARTTGNDAGVNVAFATVAVQILDPYVQNTLNIIFGGNLKINGNFKVNATTDSIAQVYVKNPTIVGAIAYPTMKISAQIGTKESPNRITITFLDGANISAKGNIEVRPVNKTYAGIKLENTNSLSSVTGIVVDADILSTETNVLTEILVGKNAYLKSEKELILDAKNSTQAQPRLDMTKNIGIWLSGGVFKHNHTIQSDITITIADGATLDAWEGMSVHGNADVYHNLTHHVENSGFIGSGDLETELTVTRNVIINIGEDVTMMLLSGDMNILSETGANDDIFIDVFGKSKGFVAFGEAHVKVTATDNARVNVDQGAHLRVNAGDINLIAKAGMKHFEIYSQWDANGLGADAEVYTNVRLNQTAIVRVGEKGAAKDVVLRANEITIHSALGDIYINTYVEANGNKQIGDVAAETNVVQNLNIQSQLYNVNTITVTDIRILATGFQKDFNTSEIRVSTKSDIGVGDSDASSKMSVEGQMKIVVDERYTQTTGRVAGWGTIFVGYDNTEKSTGGTYYIIVVEDYQGGTFVDRYSKNKKTVLKINDNMALELDETEYDGTVTVTPDIILDIYEKEDGSIGLNAFGYNVQNYEGGTRNIPRVWVENGILYMDALDLTTGGSIEITVINRTKYALSTPGVNMNGKYNGEYSVPFAGHNEFRYFTTNDKDIYITRGMGNNMWTFKVVEFNWIGDGKGNVYLSTDVVVEEIPSLDIVINEDGSYQTNVDDYIIIDENSNILISIDGNNVVMKDAKLSGAPQYFGGIYITEGTVLADVNGLEHIHYVGDRQLRGVTITNNSAYNLILGRIYEITTLDILSNKNTDLTISQIYGNADTSIKWAAGVSGNLYVTNDNYIRTGTLIIQGAKTVGTDTDPLRIELNGADAYVDIDSSEAIHLMGRTIDGYSYDIETGSTNYNVYNYLNIKHLNSEVVKLHMAPGYIGTTLIPICTEANCADITADTFYIESSSYGSWGLGNENRPLLLDVREVVFTTEDGYTGDSLSAMDHQDIYLTAVNDLNVNFNKLYMLDDDDEAIRLYAPNGNITIINNHQSNKPELIAAGDISFVDGDYTWFADSVIEAGSGNLVFGGDLILDTGKDFEWSGSVNVGGNLVFQSTKNMTVNDISVGKLVKNFARAPVSVVTNGDIIIGSGIGYGAYPVILTSNNGNVMILGREWITDVPLIDGNEVIITAKEEIVIGEGKGTIVNGSRLNLTAPTVTVQVSRISQSYISDTKTQITADAKELFVNAEEIAAVITNTGDITIIAKQSDGLVLTTPGTVNVDIALANKELDITAKALIADQVNMNNGTWNITDAVTIESLSVSGEAVLKAGEWMIHTFIDTVGAKTELLGTNIEINKDSSVNGQLLVTAANDIVVNGSLRTEDARAKMSLTAGNNLIVNGIIEKELGEVILSAKDMTIHTLSSTRSDGKVSVTATNDITITNAIQFEGNVYLEAAEAFVITADGKFTAPTVTINNGHEAVITAKEVDIETLRVAYKAAINAQDKLRLNSIMGSKESVLDITATNASLENSYTYLTHIGSFNLTAKGNLGTEDAPWYLETMGSAGDVIEMNLNVDGEIWVKPRTQSTTHAQKYNLTGTTEFFGIVGSSRLDGLDVYITQENGDLEVKSIGTGPRLHVDVAGDAVLTLPDMNIEYVNADGDVTIQTESGMDKVINYTDNDDTTITSAGDITIISGGDIGTDKNSLYMLHKVNLIHKGNGNGKVYLEADTVIYVDLKGYEDVEIAGDEVDIYSLTADGDLNVIANADLNITDLKAESTPNIYMGAANTIAFDEDLAFNIYLNDDAKRVETKEELATLLGAAVDANGTIVLNGNVTLNDVVIIKMTEEIVIDLNGYTIDQTSGNVLFAVETGEVTFTNGSMTGDDTNIPAIWLGKNVILNVENSTITGNAPIHVISGTINLLENAELIHTSGTKDGISIAGTDNSGKPLVTVITKKPDFADGTIRIEAPNGFEFAYDGKEKELEVWITTALGQTVLADESLYTITYEELTGSGYTAMEGKPVNVGTYRVVIALTEAGEAMNLQIGNNYNSLQIKKGSYSQEDIVANDTVTVLVEYGTEVSIGSLLSWDLNKIISAYPSDATVIVDEWYNMVSFSEENKTYMLEYTVTSANQELSGTITIVAIPKLGQDTFTIVAPFEGVTLPARYGNDAGENTKYGIAVQSNGNVEMTVKYSLDGVTWQSDPIIVSYNSAGSSFIGEHTIYYRIESSEGGYEGSYIFKIDKTNIRSYRNQFFDMKLEDGNGNPLEWTGYNNLPLSGSVDANTNGVYMILELSEFAKERGWKLEYYIDDGTENPEWKVFDGSKILIKDFTTVIQYRISGNDDLENSYNTVENGEAFYIFMYQIYNQADITVTEDGRIRVDGMKPGTEFNYSVGASRKNEEGWQTVYSQVVGEDGTVWLDTSLFTNDFNYISIDAYQTMPDGSQARYEVYEVNYMFVIPKIVEDMVTGSTGTTSKDGIVTTDKPTVNVQLPDTLPEETKDYVFAKYDKETGKIKILGPVNEGDSLNAEQLFDLIMSGNWTAQDYLETLQDAYNANGNGLVNETLLVLYLSDYLFEYDPEHETLEKKKADFERIFAYISEGVDGLEGVKYTQFEYSVYLHEELLPVYKDVTIRIDYPQAAYVVKENIFNEPIRVYYYDGTAKLADVVAVDADGREVVLSEDLYTIVYEKISPAQAAVLRLRQASVIPLEAGYLYRATIVLTEEAMRRYGLSEANIELGMIEFIIGEPDQNSVDKDMADGKITVKDVTVKVKEGEVIYPNPADAFTGLKDNQLVVIEDWALGVSFTEDGTYTYNYKLYTYYDDHTPIITEGTVTLIVDVIKAEDINTNVRVDGFGEDVVADPEKEYQLTVTPEDENAGLTVEYSEDNVNWQRETFKYSKPGSYTVYYRVKDSEGNVIESGMDDITIRPIPIEVETEVVSPDVKPTPSTNYYEGTLGNDNRLQIQVKVPAGDTTIYRVEYSVYIPIMENGVEIGGYWTDFTTTQPELTEGVTRVRIRVTGEGVPEYYEKYIRTYQFTMYQEGYISDIDMDRSVTVKGFVEDTYFDPDVVHQLIVTPNDPRATIRIEYSIDGINWQTEVISINSPGEHIVYYRVLDENGVVIQSGSDSIVLTEKPEGPNEPIKPEEPVDPVDPEDPTDSEKPEVSDKVTVSGKVTGAVKTGDDANGFGWLAMMLMAMLIIGWEIRRRKNR